MYGRSGILQYWSIHDYYEDLIELVEELELTQLVEFETWSRFVNGQWKSSTLDHVYVRDVVMVGNLLPVETVIGDHKLITMTIDEPKQPPIITYRRDWHKYTKDWLCLELSKLVFDEEILDVQDYWNS